MYLLIKARVEDRYNSGRLSLSIGAIQLLQEEKDRLIEKISITVPIHDLDEPTINELSTLIKTIRVRACYISRWLTANIMSYRIFSHKTYGLMSHAT